MKTRRLVAILFILVLCMSLAPGSALADGPRPITISESDLESILAKGVPASMSGVKFTLEKVPVRALPLARLPEENIYSFLSYPSMQLPAPPEVLYPPPQFDFAVGDLLSLNTYYAVLHHPAQGIRIIWVLFPQSGGVWPDDALFLGQYDDPSWYSDPEYVWVHSLYFEAVPPWEPLMGDWWYFTLVIPYDGDGNIFNREAIAPVHIYPGPW